MPTIAEGARVHHRNENRCYGHGRVTEIVRPLSGNASKAKVRFDGETADRLVWIDDLTKEHCATSAPRPRVTIVHDTVVVS